MRYRTFINISSIGSIAKLYVTLTYFFNINSAIYLNISDTVKSSAKKCKYDVFILTFAID